MATQLIVLNGGSSSGKSSIARYLQEVLPGIWLNLGVDEFIAALPDTGRDDAPIAIGSDGTVDVRPSFRVAEQAWWAGIEAMARAGVGVIVDDVFLDGADSQARLRTALAGLDCLWVGVRCQAAVAATREAHRSDRVPGMAEAQAERVHQGVVYDLEVDTTAMSTPACARLIQHHVATKLPPPPPERHSSTCVGPATAQSPASGEEQ